MAAQPEGYQVLLIAERFGQLPDTVEREMSTYWLNRAWEYMQGENIANQPKK